MTKNQCFPRCPALPPTYVCVDMVTVKAGDTLYSISEEYDVPVPILMQANKILNPYNLKIGRRICIPGPMPENPVCVGVLHTVVPSDTLYKISKQYDTDLDSILKANPTLDPYNMRVGQKICVPVPGGQVQLPEAGPQPRNAEEANIDSAAQGQMPQNTSGCTACGQSAETAEDAVPAASPAIKAILREAAEEIVDELEDLAYGHHAAICPGTNAGNAPAAPGTANGNAAAPGTTETMPGNTETMPETTQEPVANPDAGSLRPTYQVKEGDTLDSILRTLQVSLEALIWANPTLSLNDMITPGTILTLPE